MTRTLTTLALAIAKWFKTRHCRKGKHRRWHVYPSGRMEQRMASIIWKDPPNSGKLPGSLGCVPVGYTNYCLDCGVEFY